MNFSFSMSSTCQYAVRSLRLLRQWGRTRRSALAALLDPRRRAFRMTNDEIESNPPRFWPDYLRALAITVLCTVIESHEMVIPRESGS